MCIIPLETILNTMQRYKKNFTWANKNDIKVLKRVLCASTKKINFYLQFVITKLSVCYKKVTKRYKKNIKKCLRE